MNPFLSQVDPITIIKRDGSRENPYSYITETLQVSSGKVILTEIPDQFSRVIVKDLLGNRMSETSSQFPNAGQFYIDFRNGFVYFNEVDEAKKFSFEYKGMGVISFPASRVYTKKDNEYLPVAERISDLDDAITSEKARLDAQLTSITQPSEIVDLRVDSVGVTHTVARDRLISDENKINQRVDNLTTDTNTKFNSTFQRLDINAADITSVGTRIDNLSSDTNGKFNTVNTQLADITKNTLNKMDVFTTVNGTKCLDGIKVSAILNDSTKMNETFYLKSGTYLLVNPITITHEVSLYLEDDAFIKAYQAMDYMFYYSLGLDVTGSTKNKVIHGGKWDGNGLATTCLRFNITTNVAVENMQISNPIAYGLDVQAGYEFIARHLNFINTIDTNIEAIVNSVTIGNTAMRINTFDGVYNDITIVNYTVGIECVKNANYYTNVHMWGNQANRLASTYNTGIIDRSGYNFFDKVYFDTFNLAYYATSAITTGNSHLTNCMFGYADNYKVAGKTPVYISNQSTMPIIFKDCGFRYDRQGGSTNVAQISTGNSDLLQFRDCDFATPTTLTNVPTNRAIYAPKIYKFKLNFTGLTAITAGNGVNVEQNLSTLFSFNSLTYDDTVIINPTLTSWGIHIQPYVNNNVIGLHLQNTSASTVTPSNITVYVTIIKNYDKTVLPYI